ncbi:WD40 repeat domain-containing serine/threonine protein kinase [Prauserella marina]
MLRASDMAVVGPYRVLAELGEGGMGRVLLGCGPDGRLVAVKVVHERFAGDGGFRARFRREVEASKAVSGAYTAAVVDADADAATPWLASVFVPGPSLREAVDAAGPLPGEPALRLAAGLATALGHIHRAGLVHRDVKPSNVLLTEDGPLLIDFGIVRAVDAGKGGDLTRSGWLIGSPAFMSPEQAMAEPVTPASDVFSLGSVVAAACTGASPFAGAATLQTLNKVVDAPADLTKLPAEVREVVRPCLAKDPADRPSPSELLDLIGPVRPSSRPWPSGVHELIRRRSHEVALLLDDDTTLQGPAPTSALPPTKVSAPSAPSVPAVTGTRRRLLVLAIVAVLVLAGVTTRTLWPSGEASPEKKEATGWRQTGTLDLHAPADWVLFSPDGTTMAVVYEDGTVQFRNHRSGEPLSQVFGPVDRSSAQAFTEDGDVFVTGADSGVLRGWSVPSAEEETAEVVLADHPRAVGLNRNARIAVVHLGGSDGVEAWELVGPVKLGLPETSAVVVSPDGSTLAYDPTPGPEGEATYPLQLWDVDSGRPVGKVLAPLEGDVQLSQFSTDNRMLVTLTKREGEAVVRLWDTATQNQIRPPFTVEDIDGGERIGIQLSPDGSGLILADNDTVRWLDLTEGRQKGPVLEGVSYASFTGEGNTLATTDGTGTVRFWHTPSG